MKTKNKKKNNKLPTTLHLIHTLIKSKHQLLFSFLEMPKNSKLIFFCFFKKKYFIYPKKKLYNCPSLSMSITNMYNRSGDQLYME